VEPDRVFVRKVQDLRSRTDPAALAAAADPDYDVLMAAPLLRELLMGDPPLLHLVNRSRRLKVRFRVARVNAYEREVLADAPIFYERVDGLYPGSALPNSTVEALSVDKLLSEMVMIVQGNTISVRDLIDYVANVAGGVHFGDPKRDKRAIMVALDGQWKLGGIDVSMRCLVAVGQIVTEALDRLVLRVEADISR
jgi:hypothetical protein